MADQQAMQATTGWQPIETAPRDGTRVLLWCVHANAAYSPDPVGEGWEAAVIGQWIDHNGGGWTWHGLCGRMTHWRPLPRAPMPDDPQREPARGNLCAEGIVACMARADVYRQLERWFSRLTTMQCPATWEERMRKRAEEWEKVARDG